MRPSSAIAPMLSGAAIKDWIASRGAVTGCFLVYDDFFAYRSGVYRHVSGALAGGHCVAIIGYDDAQSCWICKNSWGPGWGDAGFFRIAYGELTFELTRYDLGGRVTDRDVEVAKKISSVYRARS